MSDNRHRAASTRRISVHQSGKEMSFESLWKMRGTGPCPMIGSLFYPMEAKWEPVFEHSTGRALRSGPLSTGHPRCAWLCELSWSMVFHTFYGGDRTTSNYIMTLTRRYRA